MELEAYKALSWLKTRCNSPASNIRAPIGGLFMHLYQLQIWISPTVCGTEATLSASWDIMWWRSIACYTKTGCLLSRPKFYNPDRSVWTSGASWPTYFGLARQWLDYLISGVGIIGSAMVVCVMALTGHRVSQNIQAISQGSLMAMVLKLLVKPGGCGHTATQAPHWMQAFQLTVNNTASLLLMVKFFYKPNPD